MAQWTCFRCQTEIISRRKPQRLWSEKRLAQLFSTQATNNSQNSTDSFNPPPVRKILMDLKVSETRVKKSTLEKQQKIPKPSSFKSLPEPTWSVDSLKPPKRSELSTNEVSPEQLRHLLRLSALPLPKDDEEERKMLQRLHEQLFFVRDIQKVDTTGVEPLTSIRDETTAGIEDTTIGLQQLLPSFKDETYIGEMKRPRRKGAPADFESFDPSTLESERIGGYFVVRKTKEMSTQKPLSKSTEEADLLPE